MSFGDKMDIAQLVISLVTLAATIYIPERIKWEQRYSQLLSDYRGYDFAVAVQGVVQFFSKNCKGNVENISTEYSKVYSEQVESKEIDNSKILHFQRRLLNQFYIELNQCAKSIFIGKRRVTRDFTSNEAKLLKIIYFMNLATENNPKIFKDIYTSELISKPQNLKGANKQISEIFHLLKKSKEYMR